jgi:RNA-directed DNA polymerase
VKGALKKLNARLQAIELPLYMQGGIKGRSSVTNALTHAGADAVLKADIKDFFPSIGFQRVEAMCRTRLNCSAKVATAMATMCTYKDALPQGSPTSTMVANFVIEHLAVRLHKLAKQHGAKYSQYVDDIAISGPCHVEDLKPLVARIIEEEGFVCHPDKLVVCHAGDEHEITGVRVDHGKDVPSKKLKAVRAAVEAVADAVEPMSDKDSRSLDGKVQHIATLNRGAGKLLKRRLSRVREKTVSS